MCSVFASSQVRKLVIRANCLAALDAQSDEHPRRKPTRVRIDTEVRQMLCGAPVPCKPSVFGDSDSMGKRDSVMVLFDSEGMWVNSGRGSRKFVPLPPMGISLVGRRK